MSRTNDDYRALAEQLRKQLDRERARTTSLESAYRSLEVQLNEAEHQRDEAQAELHTLRVRPLVTVLGRLVGCCN